MVKVTPKVSKNPSKADKQKPAHVIAAKAAQAKKSQETPVAKAEIVNAEQYYKIDKEATVKHSFEHAKDNRPHKISSHERRKIEKIRTHVPPKETQKPAVQEKPKAHLPLALDNTVDPWAETPKDFTQPKPELKSSVPVVNPPVIAPKSGQSYNPRLQDHLGLIKKEVEIQETMSKPVPEATRDQRHNKKLENAKKQIQEHLKKQRLAKLGKAGKANYLEAQKLKEQKKRDNEAKQIDIYINENRRKIKKHAASLQAKAQLKQQRIESIAKGETKIYRLQNSKFNLRDTKTTDFVLPNQLPKSLKDASASIADGVRDRFESIYKRGLIEYKPIGKAQRMHKYKQHSTHEGHNVFVDGEPPR